MGSSISQLALYPSLSLCMVTARCLGVSLSTLIPCSCLRMRALQHRLHVAGPQSSETALVSWDDSCLRDLRWWSVPSHLEEGVDLALPHPELMLFTDASDSGWGAYLGDAHLSGL